MTLKGKYITALIYSFIWFLFSLLFAIPWIVEISKFVPIWIAWFVITGMALIPGIAMSFINISLLMDKRPKYTELIEYPKISIIVAAYNEQESIENTLISILEQDYNNIINIIVANDGSTDNTKNIVLNFINKNSVENIRIVDSKYNIGKANVLNLALKEIIDEYVITLDADSELHPNSLKSIVNSMINKDKTYAAVAGTILCKNYNESFIAKLQDWDYLLGISAVKRIQSMYKGTLVAQGAFSIYRRYVLEEVGGWPDKIGEDIVLSWAILNKGYYIDHSEEAVCWTNVPITYKVFYLQRKRWSRGLIEAFRQYPNLLLKKEMYIFFIWYNLMFPYIDIMFIFFFIPGILAAIFFKFYLLAGSITLYLLPMTFLYSFIIFNIQKKELNKLKISMINKNVNYILYMFLYQFIMTPATLAGYISEILKTKRVWK
jgi:biofilm PGA synthesis N-glycosyltransferase PgaC